MELRRKTRNPRTPNARSGALRVEHQSGNAAQSLLTPLYDVISVWPVVGKKGNQLHEKKTKLAMAVRGKNKHYRIADIRRDHFNTTARACGLGHDMNDIIDEVVETTPLAIDQVGNNLPKGFPTSVFSSITAGLEKASRSLEAAARVGS